MKRLISKVLIILILLELPLAQAMAKSATSKPQDSESESQPSLEVNQKDVEFSERSESATKFFFKDIPRDLGGSMKTSFWGWGGLAFGLGMGLTGGLTQVDHKLQNSFKQNAIFGNTGDEIISWTFSPYTFGGVALIGFLAAHQTHHRKFELTMLTLGEALFLSMGIDGVAKLAFRRQRPDGGNFSFPSGHSTAAFTTAGVLTTFYGWKAAIPSYAMASLVSIARVDDYKHWLSDVVGGAVLGTVIGIGTARFQKNKNHNLFVYPQVNHERATIGFTYIH